MIFRQRGFTLLEALVAMAIFSFIGVASYSLLASTGRLKESGDAGYRSLSGLQLAMRQIEEDVSQFAPRPVAAAGSEPDAAIDASPDDAVFALTRAGWRNPLSLPRSGLQRVEWVLDEDGRLLRRYRRDIDDNDPEERVEREYLDGVDAFELRYMDDNGKWLEDWSTEASAASQAPGSVPGTGATARPPAPVPVAVEVKISQARIGEVNRVIPLR